MSSAALKAKPILSPPELIRTVIDGQQKQICQEQGFMVAEEAKSAVAIDGNAETFFAAPVTTVLWPSELGTRKESESLLFSKNFRSSKEKSGLIEEMRVVISNLTKSTSLLVEVLTVADEFITNALYNAPNINPITGVHTKVERTTAVELPVEKSPRIFLGEDGHRLLVGIQDPFGSLNVGAYLDRTCRCYLNGLKESINFGPGGAGIGSYIIFNAGSSLYFGVKPGRATLMICVVPYRLSGRKREMLPKHLHWIQVK